MNSVFFYHTKEEKKNNRVTKLCTYYKLNVTFDLRIIWIFLASLSCRRPTWLLIAHLISSFHVSNNLSSVLILSCVVSFASPFQLQFTIIIMIIPPSSKKNPAQKCLLFNISNRDDCAVRTTQTYYYLIWRKLFFELFWFAIYKYGFIYNVSGNWVTGGFLSDRQTRNQTIVPCKMTWKRE